MNKYQRLFISHVEKKLRDWESSEGEVDGLDAYRFVHSAKGTAGTVGLTAWQEAAEQLLAQMDEQRKSWPAAAWNQFVEPLRKLLQQTYEQEGHEAVPAQTVQQGSMVYDASEEDKLVLLVDDDVQLLQIMKETLERQGFMVLATPNVDKAIEWFYSMRPDCVILDFILREQSGFDVLSTIQAQCDASMIPVVMISAKDDKETRMMSYRKGADDFIGKPLDLEEFAERIANRLRRRNQWARLLMLDHVTELMTRPYFDKEIMKQAAQCKAEGIPLSVAMLDISGFREVNEKYGYTGGDSLLKQLGTLLRSNTDEKQLLARSRSDRFLLSLPGEDAAACEASLAQLLKALASHTFELAGDKMTLNMTAGYAEVSSLEDASRWFDAVSRGLKAVKSMEGAHAAAHAELAATMQSASLKVAIIDDDSLIRNMLSKRLGSMDIEEELDIRSYQDGEDFFSDGWHLEGGKVLLIVDRMMPRMNGMEVVARLRGSGAYKHVTILMLTGLGEEHSIEEAMRAGVDDYMTKPFSLVELEARLRKLIRGMTRI